MVGEATGGALRRGLRSLRRSPRFTIPAIGTIALGIGLGAPLLSLAARGMDHPDPLSAPLGIEVPTTRDGGPIGRPTTALERLLGASPSLGESVRSPLEIQREDVAELLRTVDLVGFLALAIAAVDLVLLLLIRGGVLAREMAVRGALGATPRRLLQRASGEGALLALMGTAAGLIVAACGVALLRASWPEGMAAWLDGPLPFAAVALAVGGPAVVVVVSASMATRGGREAVLRSHLAAARTTPGPRAGAHRARLTTAAVAGSAVLLVAAGVLLRSFGGSAAADVAGLDLSDTLTLQIALPPADQEERARTLERLLDRLAAEPGVRAAALSSPGAWTGLGAEELVHALTGEPSAPGWLRPARFHAVGPGYFAALGLPVVAGREFDRGDGRDAASVVVVDEIFAWRIFRGVDPLGKQIQLGGVSLDGEFHTVVGVVRQPRVRGIGSPSEPMPAIYLPALQQPPSRVALAVRAGEAGDPFALVAAVEGAVRAAAASASVSEVMTMQERLARAAAPLRWFGGVFAVAAALALALAAAGVHGVVAYGVATRTREIGIRLAVGATPASIVRMVLAECARITGRGLLLGLAAALCVARLLSFLFHGVDSLDPVVYAVTTTLLAVVSLTAALGPARAAAAIAPAIPLREE